MMLFYNFISEIKSQLVALTVEKDYRIEWNYLDNEGECINGFFQSRVISTEELEVLVSELQNSFMKKNIPLYILEKLLEQIQTE